eukprot:Skav217395  [mRNA]  locus=scaffold532:481594:490078:+ [translate_table: standard]
MHRMRALRQHPAHVFTGDHHWDQNAILFPISTFVLNKLQCFSQFIGIQVIVFVLVELFENHIHIMRMTCVVTHLGDDVQDQHAREEPFLP